MDKPFSESKTHLLPIGHLQITKSDNYGTYQSRCIANIDIHPSEITTDDFFTIMDKWHPKHWAGSYRFVADPNTNVESRYLSLLLPVTEDNLDWRKNNLDCQFLKRMTELGSKVKKLPVAVTEKDVKKFLIGFEKLLINIESQNDVLSEYNSQYSKQSM